MVFTRKKRQSNRRLLSQLDDYDQDVNIGNFASEEREKAVVNKGSNDRDFTIGTSSDKLVTNENTVNVKTLEKCFKDRIDSEMSNIVDTVEDRIQNGILTAIDSIVPPKIELAIRSLKASSGWDATSVTENSERGEHVGINVSFENASRNSNVLDVSNVNDETRNNLPDEISECCRFQIHVLTGKHTLITVINVCVFFNRRSEKSLILQSLCFFRKTFFSPRIYPPCRQTPTL